MAPAPAAARDERRFHFVPDELCVVVTLESRVDPGALLRPGVQSDLYDATRAALDRALREELPRAERDVDSDDPVRRDLAPQRLREEVVDRYGRLLSDLRQSKYFRPRNAGSQVPALPWVLLPRPDGRLTALYFYGIGGDDHRADPAWRGVVRELVNLCNRAYRRRPLDLPAPLARLATVRVEAGTPNWFTGAAPGGEIEGGPGSGPEPVPPGDDKKPPFGQFKDGGNATLAGLLPPEDRAFLADESEEKRDVIVAVLDTCPVDGKEQFKDEVAKPAFKENWLLQEMAASPHVHFDAPRFLSAGYIWDVVANWRQWSPFNPAAPAPSHHAQHEMPDHGLFAAGIVRTIAPGAEIRLIRVLDRYGVGDLLALTQVLALLPQTLLGEGPFDRPGERRLIVNLSLTADLPPDEALLDLWFPATARDRDALRRRNSDICATLNTIQLGLRAVVEWLAARDNILLVAAAGNEGQRPGGRPEPAAPARYDCVLGVGALRANDAPARFSNRGDIAVFGNGMAIFGGNVKADPAGNLGIIDTGDDGRPDAVVGVAIAPDLAPEGKPNETGWAHWAGTSFAAPIVSGLAAALWSRPATSVLPARDLLDEIARIAGQREPELDCPFLEIDQVR